MRVLVLTKRQYMARDLIDDRYGRFRELPLAVAAAGHEVAGVCLSYRPRAAGEVADVRGGGQVRWITLNLRALIGAGPGAYWPTLRRLHAGTPFDLVIACSDAVHVLLGSSAARRLGIPLAVDLYDNFESYGLTRWLGITRPFRRAVAAAAGVVCISPPLATRVREVYGFRGPLAVIENGVPADLFRPHEKAAARHALGLPMEAPLVGTVGSLSANRGIGALFAAFERLRSDTPGLGLVLAGPSDPRAPPPSGPGVFHLGMLSQDQVPLALSALDVAVICNRRGAFGDFCFPQKLYEAVACGVPLVAAATPVVADLLAGQPGHLYTPDDPDDLARRLRAVLADPRPLPLTAPSWDDLGGRLAAFLSGLVPA